MSQERSMTHHHQSSEGILAQDTLPGETLAQDTLPGDTFVKDTLLLQTQ